MSEIENVIKNDDNSSILNFDISSDLEMDVENDGVIEVILATQNVLFNTLLNKIPISFMNLLIVFLTFIV